MICYYSWKIRFKALAFLYLLPLTLIKNIYISCQSSDHFRKLTIIDHKYKIPMLALQNCPNSLTGQSKDLFSSAR